MPQWRGSRKTARFPCSFTSSYSSARPQWRGSRKTARFEEPYRSVTAAVVPQWRGSRKTARFRKDKGMTDKSYHRRNGGAVGRLPVSRVRVPPRVQIRSRNGGAVGRLPVSRCYLLIWPECVIWPQWRGSRKTARFPAVVRPRRP